MSEPLRARKNTDGDVKRDLEFPPLPEPLTVSVYDNHTHPEIADGDNPLPPEENLRRALLISRGDPSVFITRPISAAFLVATALLLAFMIVPSFRKKREEAVADSESL